MQRTLEIRTRPRLGLLSMLAAAVASVAIACGGGGAEPSASSQPRQEAVDTAAEKDTSGSGGVLRVAMSAGNVPIPDQFPTEGGEGRRFVGVNVYDGLLNWDAAQGDKVPDPIPGLASSWTRSADNLTWTFVLRQGVKFHDGTAFNADAVVFALDRVLNKESEFYAQTQATAGSSSVAAIASYKKVDDFTVSITTKKPWAFLPYDLAAVSIPSPAAVKQWGNKAYPQHPSGSGPFRVTKYVDGQVMELEPNKEYWGTKAKLDKLILYPMPEPAARLAALQAGQVDWAEVPPPDSIEQLKGSGYNVLLKSYPHTIYYGFNTYKAPFNDARVRQAIAYGIDRAGIVSIIQGAGKPATQLMYEGNAWRDTSFEGYSYNPDKAKALLAEAGVKGLKMSVVYPTGGSGNMWPGPMNEKFQQDMKAIGIDVDLVPMEWNTLLAMYRAGFGNPDYGTKYDAFYFSPNTQTPLNAFASYLSERIPPAGCCNTMGYSNPKADAVFAQAAAEFDKVKQDQLIAQFQGMMIRDAPIAPVVHDLNLRVLSPKVRGWVQPQSWWGDFRSVWMKG